LETESFFAKLASAFANFAVFLILQALTQSTQGFRKERKGKLTHYRLNQLASQKEWTEQERCLLSPFLFSINAIRLAASSRLDPAE
jgi:hypothetical protein